jgi:limonene-1,2-epoxide hydrolase
VPYNRRMLTRREALSAASLAAFGLGTANVLEAQPRQLTAEESTNMKAVDELVAAFNARDPKRIVNCLAEDARFAAGPIGKFPALQNPVKTFESFITTTKSMKMTVRPGTQQAHGPMITHVRVDQVVMQNGSTNGSGLWFGVFGLRGGKIVDFIDWQIG